MSKTIVITGANRGIGLAMAKICQQRGDSVYALCRQSSPQLNALKVNVIEGIDIATDAGIAHAQAELANVAIDLLINNAGILRDESLECFNKNTIIEQFTVNALAPIALTQALLSNLSANSKVALITSRMGSITDNGSGGRYGYRMSKAALNIAAVSLAKDLAADKISVGIYHPGYVQTDMVNALGQTSNGDISSDVAAQRLLTLMSELTMAESGVFKHSNGEILPW
ncbi:MAG: SDR family oxidoreductase [Colwellia sp.]|nr:SDR family oxidoreductase [Colwellia sp.]